MIIIIGQLPQLLGINVEADSTLGTLWRVLTHIGDARWRTIALGVILLILSS